MGVLLVVELCLIAMAVMAIIFGIWFEESSVDELLILIPDECEAV